MPNNSQNPKTKSNTNQTTILNDNDIIQSAYLYYISQIQKKFN